MNLRKLPDWRNSSALKGNIYEKFSRFFSGSYFIISTAIASWISFRFVSSLYPGNLSKIVPGIHRNNLLMVLQFFLVFIKELFQFILFLQKIFQCYSFSKISARFLQIISDITSDIFGIITKKFGKILRFLPTNT